MNFAKYLLNKRAFVFLAAGVAGFAVVYFMPFSLSAQAQTPVYADTPADAWYYEYIEALQSRGVFEGTECDEGFCPNQPLPRWQMAVWLVRALEETEPRATSSRFADVENHLWWMPYTERLADLEITVGCKSEPLSYCPDRFVSRSQMAAFLTRAFKLPDAESPAGFDDVSEESWAFNYINALAASKITVGCRSEPLSYCPSRSVTRAQMAAFIYRGIEWKEAQTDNNDPIQEQPEFITEENDFSRWVKHDLIDEYGDKWPWLKEVWDYTNREDFEYLTQDGFSIGFRSLDSEQTGDTFYYLSEAYSLSASSIHIGNPSSLSVLVHELAHIYTLSHGVSSNPELVAIAFLYFDQLSGRNCSPWELYAETIAVLDKNFGSDISVFWYVCSHLSDAPNSEAVTVVSQAFSGQMPDWFYETFQKADGSLDYEELWVAVYSSKHGVNTTILPMLRHSFGGYCSEQTVWDALLRKSEQQPWRDGGC